jgi:hypothetical protein
LAQSGHWTEWSDERLTVAADSIVSGGRKFAERLYKFFRTLPDQDVVGTINNVLD